MPTLEQCIACQCGACDGTTTYACAEAGYVGVRSCYDPLCAPYCNNPYLAPAQDVANRDNSWWAGMSGDAGGSSVNGGAGCCGKCGGLTNISGPAGSATGPVDPMGNPIAKRCGCGAGVSVSASIPWLLIAAIVVFFVFVKKK